MKSLVTGAAGFVGRHLVKRLNSFDVPVVALVRRSGDDLGALGVSCVVGDIRDRSAIDAAIRGVDVVYHCAAVTPGRNGALWDTNVNGTRNLVEACVANRVRRLVMLSSVTVYRAPMAQVIDEDADVGGVDLYGRSKARAEQIVRTAAGDHLEYVILRPCQVYGDGDRSGYTQRLLGMLARTIVPVGSGSTRFSLVHVNDVVDAIEAAGRRAGIAQSTFNIAGPDRTSLADLASISRGVGLGAKKRIVIPRFVLRGALIGRWLSKAISNADVRPFFRSYKRGSVHGSIWLGGPEYETKRARETLGYAAQVDPADGVLCLLQERRNE